MFRFFSFLMFLSLSIPVLSFADKDDRDQVYSWKGEIVIPLADTDSCVLEKEIASIDTATTAKSDSTTRTFSLNSEEVRVCFFKTAVNGQVVQGSDVRTIPLSSTPLTVAQNITEAQVTQAVANPEKIIENGKENFGGFLWLHSKKPGVIFEKTKATISEIAGEAEKGYSLKMLLAALLMFLFVIGLAIIKTKNKAGNILHDRLGEGTCQLLSALAFIPLIIYLFYESSMFLLALPLQSFFQLLPFIGIVAVFLAFVLIVFFGPNSKKGALPDLLFLTIIQLLLFICFLAGWKALLVYLGIDAVLFAIIYFLPGVTRWFFGLFPKKSRTATRSARP